MLWNRRTNSFPNISSLRKNAELSTKGGSTCVKRANHSSVNHVELLILVIDLRDEAEREVELLRSTQRPKQVAGKFVVWKGQKVLRD